VLQICEISLGRLSFRAQDHRSIIRDKFKPAFPSAVISLSSAGLRGINPATRQRDRGIEDCDDMSHVDRRSNRAANEIVINPARACCPPRLEAIHHSGFRFSTAPEHTNRLSGICLAELYRHPARMEALMADQTRASARSPMLTGMFRDRESAERAYGSLTGRGYTKDDVTLLMSDEARKRHFGERHDTELGSKAAEGAGVGAAVGGGLGAVLAGLAAAGTIALPGIGLIAMGPIAAALTGGAVGAAGGGLLGALIGYGIPEEQAKRYEGGIRAGNIVMGVSPRTDEDAAYFENEWRTYRGEDIYWPRRRAA
jgi:hypothetical protein